jgi:uncharacterized protein with ATP-grasp and redox domains
MEIAHHVGVGGTPADDRRVITFPHLDDLVLNPAHYGLDQEPGHSRSFSVPPALPALPPARPYRLDRGDPELVPNALRWADSHLKLTCERALAPLDLDPSRIDTFVEAVLRSFAILLRMDGGRLESSIGYNTSVYLQEGILYLALGRQVTALWHDRESRGRIANRGMAACLTDALRGQPLAELLRVSLAAGSIDGVRRAFEGRSPGTEGDADVLLDDAHRLRFGIDDSRSLEDALARSSTRHVTMFLDDNGEAAADLFLAQEILRANADLRLAIVVNEYPMSVNISLATLHDLLRMDPYEDLRKELEAGCVEIVVERQLFSVLQPSLLSPECQSVIARTDVLLLKGVGLFEAFGPLDDLDRYHLFIVEGQSARSVTGWDDGCGIVAHIPTGRPAYRATGADDVTTLRSAHSREGS